MIPAHLDDYWSHERRHGRPDTWASCVLVVEVDRVLHGT
jgi:hypothetical protein